MPTIKKFKGLNNVQRPERCGPAFLQTAVNVVITDDGVIKRRAGKDLAIAQPAHSLYSDGSYLYYVAGGDLIRNTSSGTSATTLVSDLVDASTTMSFHELNGKIYYGNGTDSGIIVDGAAVPWGVTPPAAPTAASASGMGDQGTYLVSLTYLLADGQESAASETVDVESTGGGISLTGLTDSADSRVIGTCVYVSAPNGEALENGAGLHKVRTLPVGTTGCTISDLPAMGGPCYTLGQAPMPAGRFACFYRGRMYTAVGRFVFYSLPWSYELTHLERGFLPFEQNVTALVPVENGIWVGTESEVVFLAGADPMADGGFQVKSRLKTACLCGGATVSHSSLSERQLSPGLCALLATASGVVAGDGNGLAVNITEAYWAPPTTTPSLREGFVDDVAGEAQYLFHSGDNVYAMNLATGAVTQFMAGTGSFARHGLNLYLADDDGIWAVAGNDDDGTKIAASFSKSGISFESNRIKRVTTLYAHLRSDGDLQVTSTSETGSGTVAWHDGISTSHGSKVNLPRGVQGRDLSITVSNVEGSYFELADLELVVEESTTRRARQTHA